MELAAWHIWLIIAILLFIIEIFTPTFLASCLAIGCVTAGLFALLGFGMKTQLLLFSIGTLVGYFGIRPFLLKYAHKSSGQPKTNADALVGKTGRVIVEINNLINQGRITVDGEDWKAKSEINVIIPVGTPVEIIRINSTILIVRSII